MQQVEEGEKGPRVGPRRSHPELRTLRQYVGVKSSPFQAEKASGSSQTNALDGGNLGQLIDQQASCRRRKRRQPFPLAVFNRRECSEVQLNQAKGGADCDDSVRCLKGVEWSVQRPA